MKTLTDIELKSLKILERQLKRAVPHSNQARNIGEQIAGIYRQAHLRNNPPNIAIDKAMAKLSRQLGIL